MVHDPLSIFYAAVCVGLEWVENLNNDDFCDPSPTTSGKCVPGNELEYLAIGIHIVHYLFGSFLTHRKNQFVE